MLEHGLRGVAKPEAADDDVKVPARQRRQSQPRKFNLGHGELARHQKLIAELDFVDVDIGGRAPSPPQAKHAHRRGAKIQLFEIEAHSLPDLIAAQAASQSMMGWS